MPKDQRLANRYRIISRIVTVFRVLFDVNGADEAGSRFIFWAYGLVMCGKAASFRRIV